MVLQDYAKHYRGKHLFNSQEGTREKTNCGKALHQNKISTTVTLA